MTPEKRLYLQRVRALAERIARRAGVTKPRVVYTEHDFLNGYAHVVRKVWTKHVVCTASVRVDQDRVYSPLTGGPDETPDEILPLEEARFALVNLLMQRTPYLRPRLPR